MAEQRNKRRVWGTTLLILALALPIAVLLGRHYLSQPKVEAKIVQRSVSNIEKQINSLVENNSDYHQYEKAEVALFVFHGDSLLYWNNNLVGPKLIRRKVTVGNDTICNLLTGDYYIKSFSKGNLDYYVFKLLNTTYRLENQYFENRFWPAKWLINDIVNLNALTGFPILSTNGKTLTYCEFNNRNSKKGLDFYSFIIAEALLLLWAIVLLLPQKKTEQSKKKRFKTLYGVITIIPIAILITYLYYNDNRRHENKEMATLAENLMAKRDMQFEKSYERFANELKSDSKLKEMLFAESNVLSDVILGYSKELLFDEAMKNFEVTLTICSPNEEITVQPDDYITNCDDYFLDKLANNKQNRVGDGLYYIDYYTLDPNYLGKIKIEAQDTLVQRTLYFEFYKPIAPEGFGFPQLLQEENSQKPYAYSVANYRDGMLVYKYGKYVYPSYFKDQKGRDHEFHIAEGYKHYTLKKDENNILVISTLKKDFAEIASPFAIFLLSMLIPYLFICWVAKPKEQRHIRKGSLRQRMQSLVLITLGISFLIIGPISVFYMSTLYNQKTLETEYETTRTLANQISHDLDVETLMTTANREAWTEMLQHYATTFFTDLNLYSLDGRLKATTRQEIYELTLQAPIMNAKAYQNIHRNRGLYYTHEERLGKGRYQSAYIPLNDAQGNPLAYLNTPYFSSASELQKEIKNFILTYTNIIVIFLGIALVIVLIMIRNVTKPLALLQEKMGDIEIDSENEPIEWDRNDEIGALIKQYNELIVKLKKSAEELKRTTTESAWRGVARQVAHEIKNSLTPMRLSVQLLQRNMEKGDANIEEKVQRTATTLIEQIDALSDIASSFSRYAKLPENHPAPLDLAELIGNVVNLYDNAENITFVYEYDRTKNHTYNGDKTNLNSAIGNLIKNAVQAIGSKANGRIEVRLTSTETTFVIAIKDNGKGIKDEDKNQIFLPNFTTKTNGSGVGLSLTYNIVQVAGGTITFESTEGVGTEFVIELPKQL